MQHMASYSIDATCQSLEQAACAGVRGHRSPRRTKSLMRRRFCEGFPFVVPECVRIDLTCSHSVTNAIPWHRAQKKHMCAKMLWKLSTASWQNFELRLSDAKPEGKAAQVYVPSIHQTIRIHQAELCPSVEPSEQWFRWVREAEGGKWNAGNTKQKWIRLCGLSNIWGFVFAVQRYMQNYFNFYTCTCVPIQAYHTVYHGLSHLYHLHSYSYFCPIYYIYVFASSMPMCCMCSVVSWFCRCSCCRVVWDDALPFSY